MLSELTTRSLGWSVTKIERIEMTLDKALTRIDTLSARLQKQQASIDSLLEVHPWSKKKTSK